MSTTLVCGAQTDETGSVSYYVTETECGYGVKIEQERGILTAAETEFFTKDLHEAVGFLKRLAEGTATAVSLYSLCDDYLAQKMWTEDE